MNEYELVDYVEKLGPTIVALIAAIAVVVGWFVNSWRVQVNEIKKEARQYKMEMRKSIIKFHKRFSNIISEKGKVDSQDVDLINLFEKMMEKVQLYGGNEELALISELARNFRIAAENINEKNIDEAVSHRNITIIVNRLLSVSQTKFRKDLKLEKITEKKLNKAKEDTAK